MLSPKCPSSGLQALMANAGWLMNTDPSLWYHDFIPATNITVSLLNNEALRFLGGTPSPINRGNNSLFAASSIPDFIASAIWDYYATVSEWSLPSSNDFSTLRQIDRPLLRISLETGGQLVTPHKPAVQVECGAMPFGVSDVVFPHDLFMTSPWTDDAFLNADWSIPSSEISGIAVNDVSGKVNFTWIDVARGQGPRPSLAAVFTMPRLNAEKGLNDAIYACTIGANWIPTQPWIDPATDIFVHEALPQPFTDIISDITGPSGTIPEYHPIYIDLGWAESLNVMDNATASNRTAMELLASACMVSTGSGTSMPSVGGGFFMAMSQCLQMGLALYITDGLSRMQSTLPTYFVAAGAGENMDPLPATAIQALDAQAGLHLYSASDFQNITIADLHNPANYTQFHFELLRYGYGYGFRGILIYVAVAVLLIHVLLALIHMGIVLVGGLSSSAWGTMGEMMVLMANSSSTEQLRNTCAGISKKETWGIVVKVIETADEHLELVFEEGENCRGQSQKQVKPGKKYG